MDRAERFCINNPRIFNSSEEDSDDEKSSARIYSNMRSTLQNFLSSSNNISQRIIRWELTPTQKEHLQTINSLWNYQSRLNCTIRLLIYLTYLSLNVELLPLFINDVEVDTNHRKFGSVLSSFGIDSQLTTILTHQPPLFVLSISPSSQLLCLWNRACLGVPARTEHRVPRLEAGKSAPGQGWPSENYRLWICQEAEGSHLDVVWHPRVFSPRDYSVKRTQQSCGLVGVR